MYRLEALLYKTNRIKCLGSLLSHLIRRKVFIQSVIQPAATNNNLQKINRPSKTQN